MSQLVPPHIEKLEPYVPGRSIAEIQQLYGLREVYKLASNEIRLGCRRVLIKLCFKQLPTLIAMATLPQWHYVRS